MEPTPDLLHKYRDLSGEGLTRLRQSLIAKTLWFSPPIDFNDPFDCAPAVETTWDKKGAMLTAKRAVARRGAGQSRFARRVEFRKFKNMPKRLDLVTVYDAQAAAERTMSDIRSNVGVLSLSADPENVLMWSHYSRSHTGCVLSFRTDLDDHFARAQPVIYSAERPIVDLVSDRTNTMVKTLLHKADYWSYEKEWRAIKPGQPGVHTFEVDSLAAIIFGAYTSTEHEKVIRQATAIGGLKPVFGRARFDPRLFRLHIDPC